MKPGKKNYISCHLMLMGFSNQVSPQTESTFVVREIGEEQEVMTINTGLLFGVMKIF